jgi:hypothetical protein
MPYVIAIDQGPPKDPQTVWYAGPEKPFVSFVKQATRYEIVPHDQDVLQAKGYNAYVEVVP